MPLSITTPLTVSTLISIPGTLLVLSRSAFTLVVIHVSLPGCCESVGVACSTYALSCAVGGFSALAAAAAKHMGITSIIANLLMFALRIGLSSTGA